MLRQAENDRGPPRLRIIGQSARLTLNAGGGGAKEVKKINK